MTIHKYTHKFVKKKKAKKTSSGKKLEKKYLNFLVDFSQGLFI